MLLLPFLVPVVTIFLAIVCILLLILLRINRKHIKVIERILEFNDITLSGSLGGFYHIDYVSQQEHLSPNLLKMFNLRKEVKTFEEFSRIFGNDQEILLKKLEKLKTAASIGFKVTVVIEGDKSNDYFLCLGSRIDASDGNIAGAVVWFYDVTEFANKIKYLTAENNTVVADKEKLMEIINYLPIPIWVREKGFVIRFCNSTYARFIDDGGVYKSGDAIPELEDEIYIEAKKAALNKRKYRARRHLVIDGERKLFDISEISFDDNKILGFACDISKQEEVEKELLRHISAHADLLESSSSAMAIYGRDTKLKFYNNAFIKLWDFDEKWLSSNPSYSEILELMREERKLPEQANFKDFREQQLKLFKDLIKPNNEFFHLPDGRALRVIVIPHALGGLLFAYEDMTDRLAIERSYNTLIAVQKETLDNLMEGVIVIGEDGRVKLFNPMFLQFWPQAFDMVGREPHISEIIDVSKDMFKGTDSWLNFKADMAKLMTERKIQKKRLERKDNRVLDIIALPLPDGANLVSFVDVTDSTLVENSLRERNLALEEADKLKTEFLANVSYELRTPLTSIIGFSESLKNKMLGDLNEKQTSYMDDIYECANDLLSLINDILDLASIEAGYMTLDQKHFDIYQLLYSIFKLLKERSKGMDIEIILDCNNNIGSMKGDERRIKQVLFNLLSNSVKYTKEKGMVKLGATQISDSLVSLWVEDQGIGISEKDRNKVFDRFYKTEDAMAMKTSGAGLGLSVVKSIVDLHGGTVKIESNIGLGTKVECIFERNVKQGKIKNDKVIKQ